MLLCAEQLIRGGILNGRGKSLCIYHLLLSPQVGVVSYYRSRRPDYFLFNSSKLNILRIVHESFKS